MSDATEYADANREYWEEKEYTRPNVDHDVFRFYGLVLGPDFGYWGDDGERLLDFGCGQAASTNFFHEHGFDVYGVDVSESELDTAQERYPDIADRFRTVDPEPSASDEFFGGGFDVIIALQSLYYYSDSDLNTRLRSLYRNLNDGGVLYATMCGDRHGLYSHSEPASDGLRKVTLPEADNPVYVNFTESEDDLRDTFDMFDPVHVGFYNYRFRNDSGESFHYTFVGQKSA
ncbi:bifunctional 2-polyprenyl-6-hydroxyphenol methylase/3-demethylubiquinol 3-O-methyltransferase UbiG [Halorussus sp. MSC15.2]|uniref:class I SAM-dependent methyltransferase n=1 Tax=Halorussus sp. MSC15.2 TaxID=2283638 RepID=UPI0013D7A883|nr:class I SAM-dependent methyltransferase [Halorussus sp. MSC15.2]NEU58110.1 class I SAM-dependent methyltransferase [Halorussus sp. MSC15.2]